MKIIKTASGKMAVKLSKNDWMNIGKKAGWIKEAGPDINIVQILKDSGEPGLREVVSNLTTDEILKIIIKTRYARFKDIRKMDREALIGQLIEVASKQLNAGSVFLKKAPYTPPKWSKEEYNRGFKEGLDGTKHYENPYTDPKQRELWEEGAKDATQHIIDAGPLD